MSGLEDVDPSLPAAVSSGDHRRALEAMRDKLAGLLVDADQRAAPQLAQRIQSILNELDALPGGQAVSKLDRIAADVTDDLAARRTRRATGKPDAASS